MTDKQREDLFIKWDLCGPVRRKEIINEFLSTCDGTYSQEDWLISLEDKLKNEGTRRRFGLCEEGVVR
jgi:hypothetical protein